MAVVLGSGLGAFAEELSGRLEIPYSDIPHWPASTAVGHAGRLVFGNLDTLPVVVQAGRAHLYEGHSPERVTFGVRALASLGVKSISFLRMPAGGVNPPEPWTRRSGADFRPRIAICGTKPPRRT